MPEIMSAEGFAATIPLDMCHGECEGVNESKTAELILSRDSAMLEKYKEAICKGCDGYCTKRGRLKCSHMAALDSVLAEIEGGE